MILPALKVGQVWQCRDQERRAVIHAVYDRGLHGTAYDIRIFKMLPCYQLVNALLINPLDRDDTSYRVGPSLSSYDLVTLLYEPE